MPKKITVSQTKTICEQLGLTHLIIFGVDAENKQHVATYGETQQQANEAATAGNILKRTLGWPESLCKSTPYPRIHENCEFYEKDWGMHCFNGWTGDGKHGKCLVEPIAIRVEGSARACRYYQPKEV